MRVVVRLLLAALAGVASAHPAPSSIVRLEFRPDAVLAEYWLPVTELDAARMADPAADLRTYLLRHVGAETETGVRWSLSVESIRDATYLEHDYRVAQLRFAPPGKGGSDALVLLDDAITHEVRNHVVYVTARRGAESSVVGALQYPARRLAVTALEHGDREQR